MPKPAAQQKKQQPVAPVTRTPPIERAAGEGFILPTLGNVPSQPEGGIQFFGGLPPLDERRTGLSGFGRTFESLNRNIFQPLQLALDPFAEAGGALIDVGVDVAVESVLGDRRLSDLPFINANDKLKQEQAERLERSRQSLSEIRGFLPGGEGELSAPELAGSLRERFQERPITEQIALGVSIDPVTPILAAGPLIRGGRLLGRAETAAVTTEDIAGTPITRAFIDDADSLRVPSSRIDGAIEIPEAQEAAQRAFALEDIPDILPKGPEEIVVPGRNFTKKELIDAGGGLERQQRGSLGSVEPGTIARSTAESENQFSKEIIRVRNALSREDNDATLFDDRFADFVLQAADVTSDDFNNLPKILDALTEASERAAGRSRASNIRADEEIGNATADAIERGLAKIGRGTPEQRGRTLEGAGQRPPPPRKPGVPQGANMDAPPPRRPEVGLSDDLELPTFEKPADGVMRKWEGARAAEGLAMEEWFSNGQKTLRRLDIQQFDEATMRPLFDVLHGEAGIDTLSPAMRELHDDLITLRNIEETDMLDFLRAVQGSGDSVLMATDAKNFASRIMAHPDYFPRGWRPAKTIEAAAGTARGRLGTTPSFKKPRADATFGELLESGLEPASWNPYAMMAQRRIAGVQYRESVKFVNRLRQKGLVLPVDEAAEGWRVPRAGPVFEGRPIPDPNVKGSSVFTKPLAVPNNVADFTELMFGRLPDIPGVRSIRQWSNRAKRLKLVGSLFQHVDFVSRNAGVALTPTGLRSGAPLKFPSLMANLMNVQWFPGARATLRRQLLSNTPIYKDSEISYKMLIEEGWGVQGDISLIRREFSSFLNEPSVTRGLAGKALEGLKKAQEFFEAGLFDGVYRESQRWALENFIIPWVRRTRPNATARQVAAESAETVNVMFSTLGNWQSVLKNPFIREAAHTIMFSTNETEALLRGAGRALGTGPQAGLFREWYLGLFLSMAGLANVINFTATGRPLPKESYSPIKFDDPYAPFTVGYNSRFMSPVIPFVKGRNNTDVYLDLVGQMDTAFRWALDPVGAFASRVNVIPRAIANQLKGETFFGEKLDTLVKRGSQLAIDLAAPIGATAALGAAIEEFPRLRDVIPEGEGRLGVGAQLVQASGLNLRGELTGDLLERASMDRTGRSYETLTPLDRADIRESPGVKEELERREETATKREQVVAVYLTEAERDRTEANDNIETLAEAGPGKAFRDGVSDVLTILAAKRERLADSSPEALETLANVEPKKTVADTATTRYLQATQDPSLEDPGLEGFDFKAGFNFEERDRQIEALRQEFGNQVINEVEEFLSRNQHPLQRELREDREFLEEFWGITKDMVGAFGVTPEYQAYLREQRAFERQVFLEQHPMLKDALNAASAEKRRVRQFADPRIEQTLFKWEYITSPLNPDTDVGAPQ